MSSYMPVNIDLKGKKCLVIGGGKIACRKIKALIQYDAEVSVVAKKILFDEIKELPGIIIYEREIKLEEREFEGFFIVIAATNNKKLNNEIYEIIKDKNILFNSVDDKENSNFIFPAVLKRGDLNISVSTNGKSPYLSKFIKEYLENIIDEEYKELTDNLGELRTKLFEKYDTEEERTRITKEIFEKIELNNLIKTNKIVKSFVLDQL